MVCYNDYEINQGEVTTMKIDIIKELDPLGKAYDLGRKEREAEIIRII